MHDQRPGDVAPEPGPAAAWLGQLGERLTEHGVVFYDGRGRVVAANEASGRILGRPVLVGTRFDEQAKAFCLEEEGATPLPPSEHPVALALLGVETHDRTVYASRAASAPLVAVQLDASPLRGSDGRVTGALMVLRDLTEIRRAEAFREAFLARAGHELRNPLGALATAVQILERRARKRSDPPDRALEIVVESVKNLQKLVEQMLDLSRIGRGRLVLERSRSPLGVILHAAAADVRARFPDAKIEVSVSTEEVSGVWDGGRIRQAVRAALENAVVHGRPPVVVELVAGGPLVARFRVVDRGDGVLPERRDEALQPFVRRDRQVGLGLGLAIVSEICRAHGGRFWLDDPGGGPGCAACFELPLEPIDPPP